MVISLQVFRLLECICLTSLGRATCPVLDFITLIVSGGQNKLRSCSLCSSLHHLVTPLWHLSLEVKIFHQCKINHALIFLVFWHIHILHYIILTTCGDRASAKLQGCYVQPAGHQQGLVRQKCISTWKKYPICIKRGTKNKTCKNITKELLLQDELE